MVIVVPSAPSVGVPDSATPLFPAASVMVIADDVNVEKSTVSPNVNTKVGESPSRLSVDDAISGAVVSSLTFQHSHLQLYPLLIQQEITVKHYLVLQLREQMAQQ